MVVKKPSCHYIHNCTASFNNTYTDAELTIEALPKPAPLAVKLCEIPQSR